MKKMTLIFFCFLTCFAGAAERRIEPTVPSNQACAEIIAEYVICKQPQRYIGWPSAALAKNGDILFVFSGDRDWHVCPWGKIFLVRKSPDQEHFSEPEMIMDTPLDDRDPGLVVLADGTLLLSFNTSVAFANPKVERYKPYQEHATKLSEETRQKFKGTWFSKSTDDGKMWSELIPSPVPAFHGSAVLSDGRLLTVNSSVYHSLDQGVNWQQISQIERNAETWNSRYAFLSEPHAVEVSAGHILALTRYAQGRDIRLRQLDSFDGGKTWSEPAPVSMEGYPAHLLRLKNGWLLAAYSRRLAPMGERACISKDDGKTWQGENEILLSNAVAQNAGDLGYPSSVQLPDETIWTVYYQVERTEDGEYPCLMATHWKLVK